MGKVNIVEKDGKKYIDEEEILCEYECVSSWSILIFFILLIISIAGTKYYFFENNMFDLKAYVGLAFILVLWISWFLKDFKTLLNKGIYITQKNIVTFSGINIPLEHIYYRWGRGIEWGTSGFEIFNNQQMYISCLSNGSENFTKFISTLESVSGRSILENGHYRVDPYAVKIKLIQKVGENNGRAN